jgi:3-dehydroquinate synthase
MGYGQWLHGEAVGAGMCMAATMSNQMGWMNDEETQRCVNLIEQARLPIAAPESMTEDKFQSLMSVDKKVLDGVLRLILMKGIGKSVVTSDYTTDNLKLAINNSIANHNQTAIK